MAFEWTENLAVGVETIDDQHRELLARFRDLLEACRQGQGKTRVAELFAFLDGYVAGHFRAEEALMAEHRYPAAEAHRSQHDYFVGRLAQLKALLAREGPSFDLVIDTNQTLMSWIIEHIRSTDVRFGAFLREGER